MVCLKSVLYNGNFYITFCIPAHIICFELCGKINWDSDQVHHAHIQ